MASRRPNPWAGFGVALLTVAIIAVGAWLALRPAPDAPPLPPFTPGPDARAATVVWVADGDTLEVRLPGSDAAVRARLLGIDAPEGPSQGRPAQCLADEARAALLELTPVGGTITVDDLGRDRFGRRLVALTTADGVLVNAELVRRGLAGPLVVGGDGRLQDQVRAAQAEAAASGAGLHAASGCTILGRLAGADPATAQGVLDDLLADERNALVQGLLPEARDAAEREARRLAAG